MPSDRTNPSDGDAVPSSIKNQVHQLILDCVPVSWAAVELRDDLPLGSRGLGLDSIGVVELLVTCENRWGIPFPAELLEQEPLTVGTLIDHLQSVTERMRSGEGSHGAA